MTAATTAPAGPAFDSAGQALAALGASLGYLAAVRAGLALGPDVARLARLIWETVKGQRPDLGPGPDDDGYAGRGLRLGTTTGGAAIDAVSGPGGLAASLRAKLLGVPFGGQPLVLDYGTSKDIPEATSPRGKVVRSHSPPGAPTA